MFGFMVPADGGLTTAGYVITVIAGIILFFLAIYFAGKNSDKKKLTTRQLVLWLGLLTESPEECLLREVKEETGLTLTSYKLRGLVTFISDKCEPEFMCVFTANEYTG